MSPNFSSTAAKVVFKSSEFCSHRVWTGSRLQILGVAHLETAHLHDPDLSHHISPLHSFSTTRRALHTEPLMTQPTAASITA